MINKTLTIFTGYIFIQLLGLLACVNCGPSPDKFKVTSLDWHINKAIYSDSTQPKLILSEIMNDTVIYSEYSIFIKLRGETYFSMIQKFNSLKFINTVYACDPIPITTNEKIKNIEIICDKDFDANHPSGTDLSGLFDIVVNDFEDPYHEKFDLSEFINTQPNVPYEMVLILKGPPELTEGFEFTVKYYQDGIDYDYFEFDTPRIVIKND